MKWDFDDLEQYGISRQGRFSSAVFSETIATEQMAQEFMQQAQAIRDYIKADKVETTVLSTPLRKNGKLRQMFRQHSTEMDVATATRLVQQAEALEERARMISDNLRYGLHQAGA
jgi:RNase H-fold protein (predicted Holliday junction resolvase)